MAMLVSCFACGAKYRIQDKHAGHTFTCVRCYQSIDVPPNPAVETQYARKAVSSVPRSSSPPPSLPPPQVAKSPSPSQHPATLNVRSRKVHGPKVETIEPVPTLAAKPDVRPVAKVGDSIELVSGGAGGGKTNTALAGGTVRRRFRPRGKYPIEIVVAYFGVGFSFSITLVLLYLMSAQYGRWMLPLAVIRTGIDIATLLAIAKQWRLARWIGAIGVAMTSLVQLGLGGVVCWTTIQSSQQTSGAAPYLATLATAMIGVIASALMILNGLCGSAARDYFEPSES